MKKVLLMILIVLGTMQWAKASDVVTQDLKKLPTTAQNFLSQHFPQTRISYVKIEKEFLSGKEYEVVLTSGTEVTFNGKGEWKEVDSKRASVPANIIPLTIRDYVKTNFADNIITQIEKEKRGYEVELDNDLTLKFTNEGRLISIDD
ncbi:PepSY-like domain-containing protein [Bacteroides sp. OttesenSCG-928-D19]|nr:PepSY-like domain-containing protein [Bacteroides sp. OttesenSCG-928-D19]